MIKIHIAEFIPPIFLRIYRKLKKISNISQVYEPFINLPKIDDVKWIMDVGANVGDVVVAGLASYPNAKIVAFEPVSSTFHILKNRLTDYSERVFLFNYALSDKNDHGVINITTAHGANSIESQASFHKKFNPHVQEINKENISLRKLDDCIEELPTRKIDILKIDVEGHELKVLNGGENFISNCVDVIIIEISLMRDDSWENQALFNIFQKLSEMGFRLLNVYDLHRSNSHGNQQLVQMDCVFRHKRYLNK